MYLMAGGTEFHITAALTRKDLADSDLSTGGILKVPSSELLVMDD